jgi:hypothetical protein
MQSDTFKNPDTWRVFCEEARELLTLAANINDAAEAGEKKVSVLTGRPAEEAVEAMDRLADTLDQAANFLRFSVTLARD